MEMSKCLFETPNNISGPVSLHSIYIPKKDMFIHMFGDTHKSGTLKCGNNIKHIKIENLLKCYLDSNKKNALFKYPLDIFIESDYQYAKFFHPYLSIVNHTYDVNMDIDIPLVNTIKMLRDCGYSIYKEKCEYKPNEARIHFSDIRAILDHIAYNYYTGKLDFVIESNISIPNFSKILSDIRDIYIKLLDSPKIVKQRTYITKKFDVDLYVYFKQSCISSMNSEYDNAIDQVKMSTMYKNVAISDEDKRKILYTHIIKLGSILFDYYNLCRMFRTFYDGSTCNRIITYMGSDHCKNIYDIIMNYEPLQCEQLQTIDIQYYDDIQTLINRGIPDPTIRCLQNVYPLFRIIPKNKPESINDEQSIADNHRNIIQSKYRSKYHDLLSPHINAYETSSNRSIVPFKSDTSIDLFEVFQYLITYYKFDVDKDLADEDDIKCYGRNTDLVRALLFNNGYYLTPDMINYLIENKCWYSLSNFIEYTKVKTIPDVQKLKNIVKRLMQDKYYETDRYKRDIIESVAWFYIDALKEIDMLKENEMEQFDFKHFTLKNIVKYA